MLLVSECVAIFQVPTRSSNRPGLRAQVGAVRNGAEVIDAWAKDLSTKYTGPGKASGKDSELNQRLRGCGLGVEGNKQEKCERLAAYLIENKLQI